MCRIRLCLFQSFRLTFLRLEACCLLLQGLCVCLDFLGEQIMLDDYYNGYDEEIREEQANEKYRYELMAHPDCNDPDHPGCEECCDD
jgi:hypothetical protein